jgi:hypothetical protein
MRNKIINYIINFLTFFTAFVVAISLKKGYSDFLGIPLYAFIILFSFLAIVGLVQFFARKRKHKQFEKAQK